MNKIVSIALLTLIVWSCTREKKKMLPDTSLITGLKIEPTQILYQYFEKIGFTDVCLNTRSYFLLQDYTPDQSWNVLPISDSDRIKINSLSNKIDSLKGDSINVLYQHKDFFSDILLESDEFISKTPFKQDLILLDGYYRVTDSTFEIYSPQNNTMYYELHSCDEYKHDWP